MARARFRRLALAAALLFSPPFALTPARAAPTDAQLAAARELFADAESDEDAGQWLGALEKLRRVSRVKETAGVRYHEALCEEHLGRLASALGDYTAAEAQARAENAQDVMQPVAKQLAELGPRVPRLTIRVAPDAGTATVRLDGAAVAPGLVGTAIPVDPGMHQVSRAEIGHLEMLVDRIDRGVTGAFDVNCDLTTQLLAGHRRSLSSSRLNGNRVVRHRGCSQRAGIVYVEHLSQFEIGGPGDGTQ